MGPTRPVTTIAIPCQKPDQEPMQTRLLNSTEADAAVTILRQGELVALPTETVYGLAGDASNEKAIQKIFAAKGRPPDHPLIMHVHSMEAAGEWAVDIPAQAMLLADKFWPGPLTMIFRKQPSASPLITGGLDTIALRAPDHPLTLEIIRKLGTGVAAPSANAHKKTSPTRAEHVLKSLSGRIAAVIDGGECNVGIESTIVDMTGDTPVILRPGAITKAMIEDVLGAAVAQPAGHDEKVAGNMPVHYQPETTLLIRSGAQLAELAGSESNIAIMHYSDLVMGAGVTGYRMPTDKSAYARALYATLHRIDATGVKAIYLEAPPDAPEWSDIHDRLAKASAS